MPFERAHDPDRPGQILLRDGEPVGSLFWAHDFAERERTGWFLELLEPTGEPAGEPPRRLWVSDDVERLADDRKLDRAGWLGLAATIEMTTASAAVEAAERTLKRLLGG
jgi:hypothetical protein